MKMLLRLYTVRVCILSVGLAIFAAPISSAVAAIAPPTTTPHLVAQSKPSENTPQNQPLTTPNPSSQTVNVTPAATLRSDTESRNREDDRVDIKDIYPEYCRIYFPASGSVSIFDYQEGMLKCKYGVHRR